MVFKYYYLPTIFLFPLSEIYFKSPALQKSIPIRDVKAAHIGN